ncbi:MAG: methionyl-tRNA formyltransferase [Ignavibacterium sp.]
MKIIFFGSPSFAIDPLKKIFHSEHKILAIVTVPDKAKGRGLNLGYSEVKKFALENNIKVLQPNNLTDESFINELKNLNADIFVVVAFRILPPEVFNIPKFGSFNLHASLLPKYRGAAPIQWAIINGEKETGVTTFKLEEKVDTGNIYLQKKFLIDDEDNYGTLYEKLSLLGADVIMQTLELIESGNYELIKQDNSLATPAPKITKELCQINWNKDAIEIHNLIRGLSPEPTAYFFYEGKKLKVYKSKVVSDFQLNIGEIYNTKNNFIIGCKKNALSILEIQQEGKKKLSIEEFLRGFRFNSHQIN